MRDRWARTAKLKGSEGTSCFLAVNRLWRTFFQGPVSNQAFWEPHWFGSENWSIRRIEVEGLVNELPNRLSSPHCGSEDQRVDDVSNRRREQRVTRRNDSERVLLNPSLRVHYELREHRAADMRRV